MGFKATDRCLAKVDDDEPIFVLRAQDVLAVEVIQAWYHLALVSLSSEHRVEVGECIKQFRQWQDAHPDRVRSPD